MKKESTTKQIVHQLRALTIENCHFEGVHYDAKAAESITTIAQALKENAIALGHLALLLKGQNIRVEPCIVIDRDALKAVVKVGGYSAPDKT